MLIESKSKIKILRILSIIRLILLKFNTNLGLGSLNDHLHLCSCLIIIFFYFFSFSLTWTLALCRLSFISSLCMNLFYSKFNSIFILFRIPAISFRINWGTKLGLYILNNLSFYDKWLLHLFHIFSLFWKYTV